MGRQKRETSIEIKCDGPDDDVTCGSFFECDKNDDWDGSDPNFEFTCQLVAWPIVLIVLAVVGVVVGACVCIFCCPCCAAVAVGMGIGSCCC